MTKETAVVAVPIRHEAAEFEVLLAEWQAGEAVEWAELMAAWVEMPVAPVTRRLVLRLIMGLIEK